MKNIWTRFEWQPTKATLIAGGLVLSGFLLSGISWWFITLSALGAFGPGLLRETGILMDQDEFQRQAARRAGYHAFLAAGFMCFFLMAFYRSGQRELASPNSIVTFMLALVWFTWFLSSLLSFWGVQKTVTRVLYTFGIVWLLFNILANFPDPVGMLMQSLLVVPFFTLALMAGRWPRITGVLLVVTAAVFFYFFGMFDALISNPFTKGSAEVFVLFIAPLFICGLLMVRKEKESKE